MKVIATEIDIFTAINMLEDTEYDLRDRTKLAADIVNSLDNEFKCLIPFIGKDAYYTMLGTIVETFAILTCIDDDPLNNKNKLRTNVKEMIRCLVTIKNEFETPH